MVSRDQNFSRSSSSPFVDDMVCSKFTTVVEEVPEDVGIGPERR